MISKSFAQNQAEKWAMLAGWMGLTGVAALVVVA